MYISKFCFKKRNYIMGEKSDWSGLGCTFIFHLRCFWKAKPYYCKIDLGETKHDIGKKKKEILIRFSMQVWTRINFINCADGGTRMSNFIFCLFIKLTVNFQNRVHLEVNILNSLNLKRTCNSPKKMSVIIAAGETYLKYHTQHSPL